MVTLRTVYPLSPDQTTRAAILAAGTQASRAALANGARIVGPIDWHWTDCELVGLAPIRWNSDLDLTNGSRLDTESDPVAVAQVVADQASWSSLHSEADQLAVVRILLGRGMRAPGMAARVGANVDTIQRLAGLLAADAEVAA